MTHKSHMCLLPCLLYIDLSYRNFLFYSNDLYSTPYEKISYRIYIDIHIHRPLN